MQEATTILTYVLATGFLAGGIGLVTGFCFGAFSRVWHRNQFKGWVRENMTEMQDNLNKAVREAETQAQAAVSQANREAAEVWKAAAANIAVAQGKSTELKIPPKSMN